MRISMSKDTIAALCLIMACGGLMLASLDIREPDYGVLSPAAWPRLIIVIIGVLSVIFFLQSAFGNSQNANAKIASAKDTPLPPTGFVEFLQYWRNVFAVFITFGLYLLILPHLGMLISNILLSFTLLTFLGGWRPIAIHLCIAIGTSGGMWMLFSFVLDVFLPRGTLTGF